MPPIFNESAKLEMDIQSYIMEPYTIVSYDSRKFDGKLPLLNVGKFSSIGPNCTFIMSHINYNFITTTKLDDISLFVHGKGNTTSYSRGDIIIGNDVYIGANVTIMDNVKIGNGAVIGACSLITHNVPAYAIVYGNPAKVVKYRFTEEQIEKLEKIEWWNRDDINLGKLFSTNIEAFIESYYEEKNVSI